MVLGCWRQAFQQGRVRTANRSFQRAPFAVQTAHLSCAILDLST
tara:strand:+ start:324 stop:455 length:132 start_codon:yes stop_codon:yes gene_type:complete